MCPWVRPHAPSLGRQLWGLPSRVEYLSPQGVLLPLVYGTTASPLWLELRSLSAWQATPSWTVYRLTCQRLLPWLRVTFAMVPDAAWPGSDQQPWGTAPAAGPVGRLGRPIAPDPLGVGSFLSRGRPTCARVCGVLGHLAPVHRCARLVRCFACAVSRATWLLFTGVPARCVVLLVRCPGPLGCCSPVCPLGVLCCVCGLLGHLAPVHRCARSVRCLCVRCPGELDSCSPVCPLGVLCCLCGVLGLLAPVHQCAHSVRCLCVQCPGPLGSCSPVCPLVVLCCVCGVLGRLAPVHRCARLVLCFACAVSWATWLLFTGVLARRVLLRVRCPGPLKSWSPVCPLRVLCCVCGVLGHLAPVHRCARSVRCFACAVSWASWLLFTGVSAPRVVLRMRCPGRFGSCSPVCPLGMLCCVCGVLGHLAPVHRCARCVCSVACAVSWATWLPFTSLPARCVALRVRPPGPLGFFLPVCLLGPLLCVCGVLGHLVPVHQCARSVCCFACAVSWATWPLFTDVPVRSVVLCVRCSGPLGSCSPVCPLGVLFFLCGVMGHLAPVHRCARSVCCLCVRCPGPPCSCSPLCPLGVLCCVCGVLGHLAPVQRCARSVCCVACAVSQAPSLLFTGALARCAVQCPGPLGFCSPVCALGVLCCWLRVRGVAAGCSLVHRDGDYS